jgi:ATP-dependent exoDNAse (exonuclease V) alpha subunit
MPATVHQAQKMEEVIYLISQGYKRITLTGEAGVGKTFVAKELIDHFLKNTKSLKQNKWSPESIYITAPTNKALSILQAKIPDHPNLVFKTTHSALKLARIISDREDRVYFKPSATDKNPAFDGCILAFVDECSMLETKILDMLDDFNFPIIFFGDSEQLEPVGEDCSPVFSRSYPDIKLMEIIRQGAGNPIIDLSRNLDLIKSRESNIIEGKGYVFQNDKTKIIENLALVNGTDDLKYLAHTNEEVNLMNKRVRERLYGPNPAKVELGETLVMDAPKGQHWINKEIKIEDLKLITEKILIPTSRSKYTYNGPTNCDTVKMRVYRVNDDFNIVHEQSQRMYETILASIVSNCTRLAWSWKGKYFFVEQFGQTKYNHAITVYKSQGSTYKEVVLNVGNLSCIRKPTQRKKATYTGVTRAANLLILHNI